MEESRNTLQEYRKPLTFLLKLLVSAGLIWLIFRSISVENLIQNLGSVSPAALALALALALLQVGLATLRWVALIRAIGETFELIPAVRIIYIGSFFNQMLPSSVGGDAFRMYLASKEGLALSRAVTSVLLERVLTMLVLLLVVVLFFPVLMNGNSGEELKAAFFIVLFVAATAVVGVGVLMILDRLPAIWRRFRIVRAFAEFSSDTRRLFFRPQNIALPLGLTLVSLINLVFILCVLAWSLNLDLSFFTGLALFPLVLLVAAVPISIGGWGVREGAMVAVLALVGVPAEPAFALSVIFGLLSIFSSLPGGLIWLANGYGGPDIAAAVKAAVKEGG